MESNPELDINPDSNSDLVPLSSYLSSSPSIPDIQTWWQRLSPSPTWYPSLPPPLSQKATYPPTPYSLTSCCIHHLHHCSLPNRSQKNSHRRNLPPPSIPSCTPPPPMKYPILLWIDAFSTSPFTPPPHPYCPSNY